jgi:hypothetical protein
MAHKPFIAKSKEQIAASNPDLWNELPQMERFIEQLETNEINLDATNLAEVITGICSIWSRPLVFQYATRYTEKKNGLMQFFHSIKDEWRGLIGLLALECANNKTARIEVKKVMLMPSKLPNGQPSFFELKAGAGRMLFEDSKKWTDSENLEHPYIQMIYYKSDTNGTNNRVLIGATSPYTLVFTPAQLRLGNISATDLKFCKIDKGANGSDRAKWIDPCKKMGGLNAEEVQKIYTYVENIKYNLGIYEEKINRGETDINRKFGVTHLRDTLVIPFLRDLEIYARGRGYVLVRNRILNTPSLFQTPFECVFNSEGKLYKDEQGRVRRKKQAGFSIVDLDNFLAPSEAIIALTFTPEEAKQCEAHLLNIGDKYFALPLSTDGIIFFESLGTDMLENLLLRHGHGDKVKGKSHSLTGELEGNTVIIKIAIEFYIDAEDERQDATDFYRTEKRYFIQTDATVTEKQVMMWPDFVSINWDKYFLYSGLPHDDANQPIKAFPLICEANQHLQLIQQRNPRDLSKILPLFQYSENKVVVKHLDTERLKYEIYCSDKPFKGVELRYGSLNPVVAGYLIRKVINPIIPMVEELQKVDVGVDFGSHNSCISYFNKNSGANGHMDAVQFKNRRKFLVGADSLSQNTPQRDARPYELFFFQKESTLGQFKSMLFLHKDERLTDSSKEKARAEAAVGGNLVFEKNIPSIKVNKTAPENNYVVEVARDTTAQLKHSMKWATDNQQNQYIKGFLATLLLYCRAELFAEGMQIGNIKWAYPGAMRSSTISALNINWQALARIYNCRVESFTESKAVATYAITTSGSNPGGDLKIGVEQLSIGCDVGGSTTDIFMITSIRGEASTVLIRQSSLLIAANTLAQTVKKSEQVRNELTSFLKRNGINISGQERITSDTANYYWNVVLDRLDSRQLETLYGDLFTRNCRQLHGIAAYTTGLLMYYTGLAAMQVMHKYPYIDVFDHGFYGKGGNVFNWLNFLQNDKDKEYYRNCFLLGLGEWQYQNNQKNPLTASPKVDKMTEKVTLVTGNFGTTKDNKMEVSYGLLLATPLTDKSESLSEVIGEDGYMFKDKTLLCTDGITASLLKEFGSNFIAPKKFNKLDAFVNYYCHFATDHQLFPDHTIEKMRNKLGEVPLLFTGYLTSHPQYVAAYKQGNNFDFIAPMIIMEGLCFLQEVIFKQCFPAE